MPQHDPLIAARDDGFVFESSGRVLSCAEVFEGLRTNDAFGARLTETLRSSPFPAFFWECAPVSAETAARPFQFVTIDSPELARVVADPAPFAEKIRSNGLVKTFPNLSGDCVLVVPVKKGARRTYGHLASFVRDASEDQLQALWTAVGEAAAAWLAERTQPLWLSTSGLGVHWLHVRLDSKPKYYSHTPFRRPPEA